MVRSLAILFISFSLFGCSKTLQDIIDLNENDKAVGASANDLLSASRYTTLKVDIQYMPGFAPDAGAISQLHSFLSAYLNKPGGITITTKEIPAASSTTLSANDIVNLERSTRTGGNTSSEINLYIMYTNGAYTSSNVLGIAYRNTSAALFGKTIQDNSGGIGKPSRTKLEATVLTHEVGHLLGLVNLGSPMQTAHQANDNHCNNQSCLMYYASETTDILGFLITGNIPSLDANCVADLKANGGK